MKARQVLTGGMGVALCLACGGRAIDGDRGLGPAPDSDSVGSGGSGGGVTTLLDDALNAMLDDLSRQPEANQRFTRYLLPTPYVDPDTEGDALTQLERQLRGIAKLANSLSLERAAALPEQTDSPGVLRIDLRAYGWDRPVVVAGARHADGWEAIAGNAELAIEFAGPEADRLKALAETRIPFLFARDFIATASVGDLYYELLGVPATLEELRDILDAQVLAGLDTVATPVLRGGFAASGVSYNPRVVQRVGAELAYWQAFDFRDAARGREVLYEPLFFDADATELIFTLPNGLLGYFIADQGGRRVSQSPLEGTIVDPAQPDRITRNAASCFSCHNAGVIPFSDEVRDSVLSVPASSDDRARGALLALYPAPQVLNQLQEVDNDAYRAALGRIGMKGQPDPVSTVYLDFRTLDLSATAAAAELFVSEAALRDRLRQLPGAFPGWTEAGEVPRATFNASYRVALCALQQGAQNQPAACP